MKRQLMTIAIALVSVITFGMSYGYENAAASSNHEPLVLDMDTQTSAVQKIDTDGHTQIISIEEVSDSEAETAWKNDPAFDGTTVTNEDEVLPIRTWTISPSVQNKNYKVRWSNYGAYTQYYITVKNKKITRNYGLSYGFPLATVKKISFYRTSSRAYSSFDFNIGFGKLATIYSWNGRLDAYVKNNKIYGYHN